jgi:hypothetical protein
MNKILICLIAAITLSNCDISPKKCYAQGEILWGTPGKQDFIEWGMTYRMFTVTVSGGGSISTHVVNLTKDSLEVALLRKQLAQ